MFKSDEFHNNHINKSSSELCVIVTHIESPSLFYCRLEQDLERYEELSNLIRQQVNIQLKQTPDLSCENSIGPNFPILVFSVIHNDWCRGRLISMKVDQNQQPVCIKVWLLDYGSIEFVSWKSDYVRDSTPEINNFNDAKGLCFPCCLYNIKPPHEPILGIELLQYEWTSYANFMFKKETSRNKFRLKVMQSNLLNDKIVICDLLSNDCLSMNSQFSMSHYLVKSRVAQYIDSDVKT